MASISSISTEVSTVATPNGSADPSSTSYIPQASLAASYDPAVSIPTEARKGVDRNDAEPKSTSTPTSTSIRTESGTFVMARSDSASSASPSALPGSDIATSPQTISRSGVHALIALATIGAIILFGLILYSALRALKIDVMQMLERRKRRRENHWDQIEEHRRDTFSKTLGMYNEKSIPTQRHLNAFYSPIVIPQMAATTPAKSLEEADFETQEMVHDVVVNNPPPISKIETSQQSATQTFYICPTPARQKSPPLPYDNRISELSSLSSGFGDAKIDVPESGPTNVKHKSKQGASRSENNNGQGQEFVSRFSWATTTTDARRLPREGNRDTMYTATSVESTPRFRTITSWVNQQSSRVQRQQDSDRELESLPKIPPQLAGRRKTRHRRIPSEITDPIFHQHPGDPVMMRPGSRVASFILNKKFGI